MRREEHVWAVRRRQVLDALTFEREREAILVEQLQELHAEADGERLDAALFAEMDPEDVVLVRSALGYETGPDYGSEDEDDEPDVEDGESASEQEAADYTSEEAERLEAEIASSRRAQSALTRYLELLPQSSTDG